MCVTTFILNTTYKTIYKKVGNVKKEKLNICIV